MERYLEQIVKMLNISSAGLILKPKLAVSRRRPDCVFQEGFIEDKKSG